jgi:hypothetical protein
MKPLAAFTPTTCTSPRLQNTVTCPPCTVKFRTSAVPPRVSGVLTQPGVTEGFGGGDDGVRDGVGLGVGDGDGDGDGEGDGAACRNSAADSGVDRSGDAATSTDRMPQYDTPIVAAVASAHTAR